MIVLTDDYAVRSDINQWILCKRVKVTKKSPTGWAPFKYYPTLELLARGAAQILLRTSAYDTFSELSLNAERIRAQLDIKLGDL